MYYFIFHKMVELLASLGKGVQLSLLSLFQIFCFQLLGDTYGLSVNNALFTLDKLSDGKLAVDSI